MPTASLGDVETVVRTIAQVSVDNEKYFGDLDAVVGDGDFGYSMARGFELVLRDWDSFDRADIGTFLKKVALVITSRIGGTSGPIWGTAFLRAGAAAGTATKLEPAQIVAMLRAAIGGIKARGQSDVGDKTLLDALEPAVDVIEEQVGDDEMEMGVGIHGEPGRRREKLASANAIVDELLEAVVTDLPFGQGDDVALMVNGLGGTPVSELYLIYGYAHEQLAKRGINVRRNYVGNYCTSLDMAGTSITLSRLDPEINGLLDAPAEIAIRTF